MDSKFLDKVKSEIQGLFNLPMEEKTKLWQQPGEIEGFGQAFVVSEEQKLDWSDMFYLTMQPVISRKPHLFPKLPLPFRLRFKNVCLQQSKTLLCFKISVMFLFLQRHTRDVFN